MSEDKKDNVKTEVKKDVKKAPVNKTAPKKGGSVYANKKRSQQRGRRRPDGQQDEFDQKIVDLARVTRVMAGGKRMRFRACVVIGNRKGKIGLGLDKGADVPMAVNKAVNQAKKNLIDVPMVNDTIPHEIFQKYGAGKVLLKPASKGKGVIAGGAVRSILELSGIKNITSKILGTNNNVTVAKTTIVALQNIKKVDKPAKKKEAKKSIAKKVNNKKSDKKEVKKK